MLTLKEKIDAIDNLIAETKRKRDDLEQKYDYANTIQEGIECIRDASGPLIGIHVDDFGTNFLGEWEYTPMMVNREDLLKFLTAQKDKHMDAANKQAGEIIHDTQ